MKLFSYIQILKADKKKPTPIPSGKTRPPTKDQNQQSRSSSRNMEKLDERTKSPVALTEQQIQLNKIFDEKAYNNVSHILFYLNILLLIYSSNLNQPFLLLRSSYKYKSTFED